MIPKYLVSNIVGNYFASAKAISDIEEIWGKGVLSGTQFCDVCQGYGFWEEEPSVPITYTERYYAPSTPCPRCDSDNDYFGEDGYEDSLPSPKKTSSNKSIKEMLEVFRS